MIFNPLYLLLFIPLLFSCKGQKDYTKYVNVFVGTDGHGHTFPGATVPHGMVQLSPDTRTTTWDGCSGYHYSDKSIIGFSHTHYSGTGSGGGADILLMPSTGAVQLNPGDANDTKSSYQAAFTHDQEVASPGYYRVNLEGGITAELTASIRVGFHKYTFTGSSEGNIILDLVHGIGDKIDSGYVKKISDHKIVGFRRSHGGLEGDHAVYFVAEFSKPFTLFDFFGNDQLILDQQEVGSKQVKAFFKFDTKISKVVMVKLAISKVDLEGAEGNLKEIPDWDFESVKNQAHVLWNAELSKIDIEGGTEAQQRTFYSALYHVNIQPNCNMDADRRYRSTDRKIYKADNFDNYTTFSLWDTFRALHPLFTIIDQKRTNQYIRGFIERYQHFGNLPIMEFGGSEGFAMIGYHSLPVIADAYAKGIRDYDVNQAFEGMKKLSEGFRTGKDIYKHLGFIPYDHEGASVSKTLEYCYDDWCVSVLAKSLDESDFQRYSQKGQIYRNLFSAETGFMRPKGSDYQWLNPFDPMAANGHYTEGNAYQYTTFVPHDINNLIEMMGGDQKFENLLDICFTKQHPPGKVDLQDMTGMIGQYAHGNEPSHNMAYLYNFIGKPWKTQEKVNQILTSLFTDQNDGLCGNEDAGQMSAWYVLSSMGFYPVTPGLDYYTIGSPLFSKVTLNLENAKKFVIRSHNAGPKNIYIQSASLNGKGYTKSLVTQADIMNGGELDLMMGNAPDLSWGSKPEDRPHTTGYPSASIPEIKTKDQTFLNQAIVELSCNDPKTLIRYTTDGTEPGETSNLYKEPFTMDETATLKARGFASGLNPSYTVSMDFEKLTPEPAVKTEVPPHPGIAYDYIEDYCVSVADIQKYKVTSSGVMPSFNISGIPDERAFAFRFTGFLKIPKTGIYTFYMKSNDGSNMYLDNKLLLDYDLTRSGIEKTRQKWLEQGWHPFRINYYQMGGKKSLNTKWRKPSGNIEEIPTESLFH